MKACRKSLPLTRKAAGDICCPRTLTCEQTLIFKDWRTTRQVIRTTAFAGIIFMTIFSVGAVSLCSPEEKSLFSCQLEDSKKSVSLCQSNTDHKQILYKFGTPEKVEITLPNEKSPKAKIFFE
jgi:hypothetical protein